MTASFDARQKATILAALRHWQWIVSEQLGIKITTATQMSFIRSIANDHGRLDPLTSEEIDGLCETINTQTRDGGDAGLLAFVQEIAERELWTEREARKIRKDSPSLSEQEVEEELQAAQIPLDDLIWAGDDLTDIIVRAREIRANAPTPKVHLVIHLDGGLVNGVQSLGRLPVEITCTVLDWDTSHVDMRDQPENLATFGDEGVAYVTEFEAFEATEDEIRRYRKGLDDLDEAYAARAEAYRAARAAQAGDGSTN